MSTPIFLFKYIFFFNFLFLSPSHADGKLAGIKFRMENIEKELQWNEGKPITQNQ